MEKVLTIENVSKTYKIDKGKVEALKDINLEVSAGEFFILLGPSGCGKSSLLRIISGLDKDYSGTVNYGAGVSAEDISFVFQQFALFPWLNVYENIEIGLLARNISDGEKEKRIMRELELFGLEKFSKSSPRELSGGMRQRVGIARALVTDPKIIFMDEPFSELDSFTAADLRREVLEIWQKKKTTIVMVTHLIEEAIELSDRVAVMTKRPGTVETLIENDLPRPRNKRSEQFFDLEDRLAKTIKP